MAAQEDAPSAKQSEGGMFGKLMHTVIEHVGPKLQDAIGHVEKPSADVTGEKLDSVFGLHARYNPANLVVDEKPTRFLCWARDILLMPDHGNADALES
jgi:hypothetical protein